MSARPSLALVAAVALAHAVLLRPAPPGRPGHVPRPATLALRVVDRPATLLEPAMAPSARTALADPPPKNRVAPTPRPTTAPPVRAPAARSATTSRPEARRPPPAPATARAPAATATAALAASGERAKAAPSRPAPAASAPSRDADAVLTPPTQPVSPAPTQLPGPVTLDYRVSGSARGIPFEADAQLVWRPSAGRYAAEWTVHLPLVGARTQRSEGAVTPAGLAPERYAEQARGERAAHFDAGSGRIRFSANTPDAALAPGAQDRLSVSLQLAGLLAAAPARYPPGSAITLQTSGVREAGPWRWEVQDDDVLLIDGHEVPCAKLVRHPRGDHDTRIELWLARPLGYLPARLRVTQSGGDVADQQLRALPTAR